jgi:hypothetical protein
MTPPANSAILTAIEAVNANVVATREEVAELRLSVTTKLDRHEQEIQKLREQKASEKGWVKGFKAPVVAAGMVLVFVIDHGDKLVSWFSGGKP